MYTRENLAHFEGIYDSVNVLLDIKKAVDKVEQDIRVAKTRLGMAESSELAGPSSVAGDGDLGMDVDEDAEGEADEDGRAQSVMSARSTRSRKQVSLMPISMAEYEVQKVFIHRAGGRLSRPWIRTRLVVQPRGRKRAKGSYTECGVDSTNLSKVIYHRSALSDPFLIL